VEQNCPPDTNWDFTINGEANIITFASDCKNKQNINVSLSLIKRHAEDFNNAIIGADPVLKNQPT
jgi:hypothetical protein